MTWYSIVIPLAYLAVGIVVAIAVYSDSATDSGRYDDPHQKGAPK